jgi:hypothetical protein
MCYVGWIKSRPWWKWHSLRNLEVGRSCSTEFAVDEITIWTDNCYGQNKNMSAILHFSWILHKCGQVKRINHKLILKGHPHMEANTIHAQIEPKIRKLPTSTILTPWNWQQVVRHTSTKFTYLLTKLSPSWGAANCAAPQELPSILWNPKIQYRVHKSPPLVPILSNVNPIHTIPSYPIHFDIVHPYYVLVFPVVSFLLAFSPIFYMHSSDPHSCYMSSPSHPSWLDYSNYTWRRVQVMKLLQSLPYTIWSYGISWTSKRLYNAPKICMLYRKYVNREPLKLS